MCSVLAEAIYKSRYELVTEFLEMGYEIILLAPEPDTFSAIFGESVRYYQIDLARTGLNPLSDLAAIRYMRRIIAEEKPDLTYAFGGAKAAIYTVIAAAKEQVPSNYCMINGLGSVIRGTGLRNAFAKRIMILLFGYALLRADGVLFQNEDDLNYFISRGLVDGNKTLVVNGSGVNLDRFPFSPIQRRNVFLFVGRLLRDKGIYEFVKAAGIIKARHPNADFWVVGGYDSNPTAVSEWEVSSWVDDGLIDYFGRRDDMLRFYQESSVFVLPSYHEGTPRTSLEAMAVGRPVITTDAPGCRETVIDGETGFLVPVRDVLALVEKMEYFILHPESIDTMGKLAHELAVKKYDVRKVNEVIVRFLTKGRSR